MAVLRAIPRLCFAKSLSVQDAKEAGIVTRVCPDYAGMIRDAIDEVKALQGKDYRITDSTIALSEIISAQNPKSGNLVLSKEAVSIMVNTIKQGAAADSFEKALTIGYEGFGVIACTDAASEGISAFQQRRKPKFTK